MKKIWRELKKRLSSRFVYRSKDESLDVGRKGGAGPRKERRNRKAKTIRELAPNAILQVSCLFLNFPVISVNLNRPMRLRYFLGS